MANTSIGTAWINVKPSTVGISNEITKALGNGGASAGSKFGGQFSSSFLSSAKASFSDAFAEFGKRSDAAWSSFLAQSKVAILGIGVAAGGAIAYAVKEFADYEQLVGGVRTLFKDNSVAVEAYAAGAYKNAQISANQYMETITGFSASLLQGLGGDTKKAAQIGSMAVIDMADNANKMGSSMESIQYAYQGFAKDNYTMLDNLKLGYGGTQSEMARLINDSGVMGNAFKATAENVKDIPFDKTIEAIHEIQNRLGITGTSALEASTTISGSFATAKAAFADMMSALANPEGDFNGSFQKFIDAAKQFLDNLRPVVANVFKTIFDEIEKQAPGLAKVLQDIGNVATGVFNFIKENQDLVLTVLKLVAAFKALQIATGGVRSVMSTLAPYGKLLQGTFQLAAGGVQSLIGKFGGLNKASEASKAMDGLQKSSSNLAKNTPKTFAFGESIASFLKNIGQVLSGAITAIIEPIKALLKGIGEAIAGFFKAFANPQILLGAVVFAVAVAAVAAAILLIGGAIGIVTPGLAEFWNTVLQPIGMFLLTVFVVALDAVTTAIIRLTNDAIIPLGEFMVNSFIAVIFALTSAVIALTQQAIIPLVDTFMGGLTNAIDSVSGLFESIGGVITGTVTSIGDAISKIINSIANLLTSTGNADWYGTGYGITRNFTAGLLDGIVDFIQDGLNMLINNMLKIPVVGDGLKLIGLKENPVNLSGLKLGKRAMGGAVFGAGTAMSDSIPMALSNGEYVLRTAAAQAIGYGNLDRINATGNIGGGDTYNVTIPIDGYNKDPRELANKIVDLVSNKIALKQAQVMN